MRFPAIKGHLELPPDHLVHDAGVGLNDFDNLRGNILVHVVRDRDAMVAGGIHSHRRVNCLQQGARSTTSVTSPALS